MSDLSGAVALVTGASRGIGRAIGLVLGKRGATIVGTATTESGAENIRHYLKEAGIPGEGMVLNVTDPASVDAVIKQITAQFGPVSLLVNNAGITRDNLLLRLSEDDWDQVVATNLTSVYRLSKAVLKGMMKARQGRIINIASVVGLSGNAGQVNYAAAKAGMIGFTKSLAQEMGSRAITVNCVAPGFIETDMTAALGEEQRQALLGRIALGRLGSPEEVAQAVAFLASSDAAYITGETLNINGGMYMH